MNQALEWVGLFRCLMLNKLLKVVLLCGIVISGRGVDAVANQYGGNFPLLLGGNGAFVASHALVAGARPQLSHSTVDAYGGGVGQVVQQVRYAPGIGYLLQGLIVGALFRARLWAGGVDGLHGRDVGWDVLRGEAAQTFPGARTGVDETVHVAGWYSGVVKRSGWLHSQHECVRQR